MTRLSESSASTNWRKLFNRLDTLVVAVAIGASVPACGRAQADAEQTRVTADAGAAFYGREPTVEHLFIRAGVPERGHPSATLKDDRLAVAFSMGSRVGIAIEDEPGGDASLREVITFDVEEQAVPLTVADRWTSVLVPVESGFELIAYARSSALQRASLDSAGRLRAPPELLAEGPLRGCDALHAASLIVVCTRANGRVQIHRCAQGECGAEEEIARCDGTPSAPRLLATTAGAEAVYVCAIPSSRSTTGIRCSDRTGSSCRIPAILPSSANTASASSSVPRTTRRAA
jgi:hypothetical protein